MHTPTGKAYSEFQAAYDFFNERLFANRLPPCLITMQRHARAGGYFAPESFGTRAADEVTDEIALNPQYMRRITTKFALSVLVHEMTHLEQQHFGTPSRRGYHNAEWAALMLRVGLVPSDTGQPGGKRVGQRMAHFIEEGGAFDRHCDEFLARGADLSYVDIWDEAAARKKAESKTKYTCPSCGTNVWGKPEVRVICGECHEPMRPPGKRVAEDAGADAVA